MPAPQKAQISGLRLKSGAVVDTLFPPLGDGIDVLQVAVEDGTNGRTEDVTVVVA